ncbi:MAG: ATP phosphoribosyltransferase, partial [Myxococcota bacterium]|nr:ATP phosphoribosyltransferase [Myxococcota bacterium]
QRRNEMMSPIQLGLPKGRMCDGVQALMADAGCPVRTTARDYRASIALPGFEAKILKPQGIVEMLAAGRRDIGFAGADWVCELDADLVELLDTGLDQVRIVAAAPEMLLEDGRLPDRRLVVASEYARLTQAWIAKRDLDATFLRSWGATEVLPPEDADCIVDNTATGSTLAANRLAIIDTLMTSSTRLYANPRALDNTDRRGLIEDFVLLLSSVIAARNRVMLELNVGEADLARVVEIVPCMRRPTIASLYGDDAFAVKVAVPRAELADLIPVLKRAGATDVVVSRIDQIVP